MNDRLTYRQPAGASIDASPSLQAMLDHCGEVRIPPGEYLLSETLRVHSDTSVIADPGAVFRLADGAGRNCRSFMITNANPGNGNANISLQGGFWDANNAGNLRGQDYDPFAYTGVAVNFVNVKNLTIRDLTVHNPESFFIRVGEVCDFRIENITLSADRTHINQDGVHVGGFSERGVIRGIRATAPGVPGDDMVALNADDDVERQLNLGMRRGPIRDILVEDIEANDAYTFIRLLSVEQPIEDITVRRLRGACRVHGLNLNNWRFPKGVGAIRRVLIEDVELAKTQVVDHAPAIVKISLQIDDFTLRQLKRNAATLADAKTLMIDNQHDLTMMLDGRTCQVSADAGYVQADGDIGSLNLKPRGETVRDFGTDTMAAVDEEFVEVAGSRQPVPRVIPRPDARYADENRCFGIASSIARTPGGRLWCGFSSGGEGEGHLNYGIVIISDDDGLNWSPPLMALDTDGDGPIRTDHVTFWTAPDGVLWLLWSQYPEGLIGSRSSQWAMTCANPDAGQRKWSAPFKLVDEQNLLTTPTVLANGTWIFPTGCWCRDPAHPSRPILSRDGSRHFELGGPLRVATRPDFDEYMIVERRNGNLVIFNRHAESFLQCESTDGGRTWSEQQPNGIRHVNSRFVFLKLASGNWLLVKHGALDWVTDARETHVPTNRGRSHLTAFLSRDEGLTWEGGLLLDQRDCSYPFGCQAQDGTVYVSYERSRWQKPEILVARFMEEDILAGQPVSARAALRLLANKATGSNPKTVSKL